MPVRHNDGDVELKSMKIDYFVLNNEKAQSAAAIIVAGNKQLAAPAKVLVIEDQIVPANSPEVSAAQQQMAAFARSYGTEYIYGQAFAGHYLVDEVLKGSEVVVSADKDILMVGAVGVLGICVAPEKLAECLVSGNIELDISDTVYVKIVGDLQTDSRDAARYIVEKLQGIRKNAMVCFIDASGALTVTDKMLLCGYCQKLGVVSARFIERSYEAASIIDLSSVKAELPSAAVDAVFIGGAYGGTLEAI